MTDLTKKLFNDGKNIINRLATTDDSMRNHKHMGKEFLDKIMRLTVMNSLNGTKLTMFGENAVVKVNKDTSLSCLVAIEVEKKK